MNTAATLFFLCAQVFAQQAEVDYFKLLAGAQRYARELKVRGIATPGAMNPASAVSLLGLHRRFFKEGEQWSVEVTPNSNTSMWLALDSQEAALNPIESKPRPSVFEFKVRSIVNGAKEARQAEIEVRQKLAPGDVPADSRIEHENIVVDERFTVIRKKIFYRDGRTPVEFALNEGGNVASGFEAYPIDIPDLSGVDGVPLKEVPKQIEGRIDVSRALDFRYADLYARPARAIWGDGEVWPAYVQTASGTAVVVRGRAK